MSKRKQYNPDYKAKVALEALKGERTVAYTGKNAKDGALAKFIELCEAGTIETGSILIVENLDRITRQKPLDALGLFTKLLSLGITIHTLSDGQEFSQETVNGDGGASLLFSVITLIRANEESEIISRRGAAAWRIKRQNLMHKKLTGRTPYWLELSEDKTKFHVIEERALIIRRIFKMMDDGLGALVICKTLNQEGVPNFTRTRPGGSKPTKGWSTAYVHSLVAKKAVIGYFQPRKNDDGRRVVAGDEVEDYYPAIIDEDLYYRVIAARSKRRLGVPGTGRKTKLHANLFVGLCKCGLCGASMSYRDDAKDQVLQCYPYLLRARHSHHRKEKNDQETDHPEPPLEPSATSGLTSNQDEPDPLLRNRLNSPKCFDDGQSSIEPD